MLRFLFGRALIRWLEGMAPEEHTTAPEPEPAPVPAPPPPEPVFPRVQCRAMGSLFEIYFAGTDREAMVSAGEEALDEVERLERQLSHYLGDSDVSRLNTYAAEQWVRLEPKLYSLLRRSADVSAETSGAFDITAGPLVKAWGFFRGEGRVPTEDEVAAALENVGSNRILFDDEDHLVYFTVPGLQINLGAVGKGVAVDAAAETLRFFGVENAVIHGGGSTIYAMGDAPDSEQRGWRFDVKDPRDAETVLETVWLKDEAISTSGNYEQFFEVEGVRYSHIIDPRTGRPTQGMMSASVIAPVAEETDALSTAFFVMGREATEEYCKTRPNIRVILIEEAESGDIRVSRIGFPPRSLPSSPEHSD
jgi:thiamine biosynthesis lipoprotein